ncbi:MAG: pectinesterase family protein, partial [Acidobacteriaceae bacterium]|nr:pectinesterase family protein [Acidobacteriaceae bacterium]
MSEPVIPVVKCATLQAAITADSTVTGGLTLAQETVFDTSRVQSALSACTSGQAVELAPSGAFNAFLIQPITIPAGVTLLVDAGVRVMASRNPADYNKGTSTNCGSVGGAGSGCQPLISINNAPGAAIMGYGAIDGRGGATLLVGGADSGVTWWDNATGGNEVSPVLLNVSSSANVTLYRITFQNSPHFHVTASSSNNMILWGTKIITPYDTGNTDGFDPGGFNNTTVQDAYFSDGDDEIALTGGSSPLTQNMTVNNAHFFSGHGMSIGSHTTYGISNLLVNGLTVNEVAANGSGTGLRIKSDATSGGLVQNVTYQNVCMQNVSYPIVMTAYYTTASGTSIPQYRNINFTNVHALTAGKVSFVGYDGGTTNGITDVLGMNLNNVVIDGITAGQVSSQYTQFALGPGPVNFASYLAGVGDTVTNNVSNSNAAYSCPVSAFNVLAGEIVHGPSTVTTSQNVTLQAQILTPRETSYASYLAAKGPNPATTLQLVAPTGTVSLMEGSTVLGTATLSAAAEFGNANTVSINIGTLSAGMHTITGSYSGDANYLAQTFGNYSLLVTGGATTTTTLGASGTALIPGQSVTFTALVTASSGTPTGTVMFFDGSYPLATSAVNGTGAATYTTTSLSNISHTITAVYSGDTAYGTSTSNAVVVAVTQASSAVTFTANPTTVTMGQPITFTASVAPANGSSTDVPTGNMAFKVNGKTPSNQQLVNGTIQWTVVTSTASFFAVGSNTTFGSYGGDTNFASAASPNLTITINAGAATTTTLNASATSIFPGQTVMLMAGVSSTTAGTETGTFSFFDGTTLLGTVALGTGTGNATTAQFSTSSLAVGAHSITAVYNGDSVYGISTSTATVVTAALAPTTLALSSNANGGRTTPGQSVTFTAALSVASGGTPTGSITFYDGLATLAVVTPVSGTATLATMGLSIGAHTVTASYGGDANYGASQASSVYVVVSASGTGVPVAPVLLPQVITTIAGNGTAGTSGDGGPASAATLSADLRGLAADGFGTVYIGDAANSRVRSINALSGTIKLFAGGGTVCSGHTDSAGDGCIALQMTGFKPRGIATDKLGALYIAGYTDNLVHRIDPVTNIASLVAGQVASVSSLGTAGNGADGTVATSAALNGPRGAWVDNLGNVFIADVGNRLVRMVYNAGTFTGLSTTTPVKGAIYTVAGNTTSTITDNGLATASGTSAPQGVYVDNQQNIFIPDVSRLRVVYEGGTTVAALIAATNSGTTATAGYIYTVAGGGAGAYSAGTVVLGPSIALGGITKIAADANGNLYLGDGGKNEVWFFDVQTGYIRTVAGGAATVCGTATDTIGDGCLGTAATLNVGSSAQAVAMDAQNNLYVTDPGNARLRKVSSNLSFAATAVGGTLTQAVVVHLGAGETGATFALPQGLTDFTVSGTPACVANADTTRDCTVQVVFAPAAPGFRTGQITVTSNPSGAAKTFALSGTGTGPKLVLNPGTAVALGTGLTPQGVAVDAAGNVYVANKAAGTLLKFAAGSSTPVTLVSGLSQPFQVTVDGTGNIYVADSGNNRVVAVSVAGVVSAVGTGLNAPRGVAVDSAGDVYIADTGNSRVVEVPAAPSSQVMIGSGFSGPTQLAVDAANNLYVLDQGNSRVVEIAPGASTQPVLSLGSILPVAIAVDAAADVYVADAASESVLMYAAGSSTGTALATGLSSPAGLAVNGSGTVYLADAGATAVTVLGRAAGTLTFANTSTPVSAVLTNVGNSSLSFTAPGFAQTDATDFSVAASSSGGCAFANGTLGAGASCGVTGIFSPQTTGTLTDVVTLASSGGAPVLTLSGSGTVTVGTTTTVSAPTPGAPVYGQSVTFTATVAANSGSATPTGSVVFTVDSTSGSAVTLSAGQAASASFAGLTAGTHSIAAVYTPTGAFAASSSSVGSFTVAQAAPVLNWSPAASVGYGTPLSAVENANSGGLPGVFAYTATVSGGSPVAITANSFLPVGTYALGVTFTPTDSVDYATATASVPSLTIVKAATTSGVGPTQNVVAVDGSGNFATLAAAIAALPAGGGAIYVRPGTYTGQNLISKSNVQLRGLGGDPTKVVLAGSQDAQQTGSDQASATLGVTGSNFYMETIYVNNTFQADNPTATGNTQSVALYLSGDKDVVYNSQIMARQDTLYANNGPARQYFYADKISGNVDYIFGDAAAVFDNCNIYSVYNLTATGGITITAQKKLYAANSAQNYLSGYVITNSTLTNETDLGTPTNLLYGRPWGPYSTTVFINNSIQTLNAAGWSEFTPGVTNYLPTSTYAEYGNYGPTYTTSGREQYATFLTASAAAAYAPDTFLGGTDGWSPTAGLKAYIASVVPTATSLTITPGASVTMVARVAPPALGVPTGTLTFYDGAAVLTSMALDALGEGSYTTSALANGTHSITVVYSGDSNFTGSTSGAAVVTAGTGSLTTLQMGSTSLTYGQGTTATATISPASGTGVPTGSVTFSLDGVALTPVALSAGQATLTIPGTTAVGSHVLIAAYGGDASYSGSTATAMNFTVAKAVLTVTGNSPTMVYGGSVPALSAAITGFVNSETSSVVSGSATVTTTATSASAVGSYPVTPAIGTLSATNYSFTFVNGSITVTKAAATVTVANATKAYGAALPSFTATAAGLVNGDALGATLTVGYSTGATTASAVGSYPVNATVSGTSATNYTVTVVPGSLSVTAVPLTVTVANATKAYGAALPSFTSTAAGLVNGDALGTTLTPAYTTAATAASAVGSYAVNATVSGASAGNYTVTVVPGSLSVTAVPLTVTVANATKAYGAALPSFTSTATGLVNGDALGATVTVAYTTTATASSAVGSYAVNATAAGTSAGNYSIAVVPGTLTVTTATTVTGLNASATTVTTGTSVTLTATVTSAGGVPTGTVTFLDGTTTLGSSVLNAQGVATLATTGMVVGTNPVTASYAGDASFAASVSAATTITGVVPPSFSLSVSPTTLVITSGSTGAATITFTPVGGYTGTVTLSCGSLPANVYCTFTPLTLTANGSNTVQTSTLSIATNGVAANHMPGVAPMYMAGLMMLPLGLLL